jgi:hypothetical protein
MSKEVRGMFKDYVDEDEVLLGTIHKHSFGIFIVYLQAIVGVILVLGLAFFLLPKVIDDAYNVAVGFSALAVFFALVIVVASTIIYNQSSIVITDKNITQILQDGLFGRKVSQLTMANVEDVTALQHGFFATMFDFGELKIETAGEQANFVFGYCPRPGYYAKIILEAREKFMAHEYSYMNAMRGHMPPQYAQPAPQEAAPVQQQAQEAPGPPEQKPQQ